VSNISTASNASFTLPRIGAKALPLKQYSSAAINKLRLRQVRVKAVENLSVSRNPARR
jgi:hypothetical protein